MPEKVAVPPDGVLVVVPVIAALLASSAINVRVTASLNVDRVLPALSYASTVGENALPTVKGPAGSVTTKAETPPAVMLKVLDS